MVVVGKVDAGARARRGRKQLLAFVFAILDLNVTRVCFGKLLE